MPSASGSSPGRWTSPSCSRGCWRSDVDGVISNDPRIFGGAQKYGICEDHLFGVERRQGLSLDSCPWFVASRSSSCWPQLPRSRCERPAERRRRHPDDHRRRYRDDHDCAAERPDRGRRHDLRRRRRRHDGRTGEGGRAGGIRPAGAVRLEEAQWWAAADRLGAKSYVAGAVNRALSAPAGSDVERRRRRQGRGRRRVRRVPEPKLRAPGEELDAPARELRPKISEARTGVDIREPEMRKAITRALQARATRGPIALAAKVIEPTVTLRDFGPVVVIRRESKSLYLYRGSGSGGSSASRPGSPRIRRRSGTSRSSTMQRNPWWYPPPDSDWAQGPEARSSGARRTRSARAGWGSRRRSSASTGLRTPGLDRVLRLARLHPDADSATPSGSSTTSRSGRPVFIRAV